MTEPFSIHDFNETMMDDPTLYRYFNAMESDMPIDDNVSVSTESSFKQTFDNYDEPHESPTENSEDSEALGIWPPLGFHRSDKLGGETASELVSSGAALFRGHSVIDARSHDQQYRFYADTTSEPLSTETPCPTFSFTLGSKLGSDAPWKTLEQPSMLNAFGATNGTITFNHWITTSKAQNFSTVPAQSRVVLRDLDDVWVLDRVIFLQSRIEDDIFERFEMLYGKIMVHERSCENATFESDLMNQITDLIDVLHTTDFIDFTRLENQFMSSYLHSPNAPLVLKFFVQLMLSMELYHRLELLQEKEKEDSKIYDKLPLIVAYDVALASMWIKSITLRKLDEHTRATERIRHIKFCYRNDMMSHLYDFASDISWPSLDLVESAIRGDTHDKGPSLESCDPAAMSWATGVVLPGQLTSWLMMRTLVATNRELSVQLKGLEQMRPNSGFQWGALTCWKSECIVGKTLGILQPAIQRAGFIARCMGSKNLKPIQFVTVKQQEVPHVMSARKVGAIAMNTDPLGPMDDHYPVSEYKIPQVASKQYQHDAIKITELKFRIAQDSLPEDPIHEAALAVEYQGLTCILPLVHNVSFITAAYCENNPHPLYFEYGYQIIEIKELPKLQQKWTRITPNDSPIRKTFPYMNAFNSTYQAQSFSSRPSMERVLVIEAFGLVEAEVLARAWCAKIGHHAIVADLYNTCTACAVRMAFAANVDVVILTNRDVAVKSSKDSGYYG